MWGYHTGIRVGHLRCDTMSLGDGALGSLADWLLEIKHHITLKCWSLLPHNTNCFPEDFNPQVWILFFTSLIITVCELNTQIITTDIFSHRLSYLCLFGIQWLCLLCFLAFPQEVWTNPGCQVSMVTKFWIVVLIFVGPKYGGSYMSPF
jgi:anaerobic C4-dicarboxylate transporter